MTAQPDAAAVPAASRSRERWAWIVSAALLIGIVALAVPTYKYFSEPAPPEMRLDIETPPSSEPLEFALSPDGMRLVFVANDNGAQRLWVRPLNAVAAQPLAGTDGAAYPFWSPDSRSIGFSGDGKLKRIDIAGGPPQILADAPGFRGGAWNNDGVILFAPTTFGSLVRIAATGGKPEAVTHLEQGHTSHRFPQFLPDGRHFLYYVQATPEQAGTYLASIDGNAPKLLVDGDTTGTWVPPGWVLYQQQGALRAQQLDISRGALAGSPVIVADPVGYDANFFYGAFSASIGGTVAYRSGASSTQLTWFERSGKTAGTVGDPDENALGFPELSPDGRRVAVDRTVRRNQDVWLMDVLRGGVTRFTFDTAQDRRPIWSPDGAQIVFQSNRKRGVGNFDLYTKPSSGAGNEQLLLESTNQKTAFGWSFDGRFLLYGEDVPNKLRDLFALSMPDRKPQVIANSPFDERNPEFSPDGRWVAYHSNESGRFEVYVVPFPTGSGKWQVSTSGGISPRWRRDGKELFFIAPDGTMMAAAISASGTSFDAAPPLALFQTRIMGGGSNSINKPQYAVAADGRFLINVSAGESTTLPITLLLNWSPERAK